ncbi:Uncharacterised protein [Bordetella pertussis]|nr:Uncharacterised protein [Bordetella pertussis]
MITRRAVNSIFMLLGWSPIRAPISDVWPTTPSTLNGVSPAPTSG